MARGDVFWVELPSPIGGAGHEQAGRRPAVVVQSDDSQTPLAVIIPITSQPGAVRFPYVISIEPSSRNGLGVRSFLLVFQIRAIDQNRLHGRVGHLESHYLDQLDSELRRMLGL